MCRDHTLLNYQAWHDSASSGGALEYTAPRWEGEDTPVGEGVTNGWDTAYLRPTGLCDSLRTSTTTLLALARTI